MPQYVIEREIPGAGDLSQDDLKGISQKSCGILKDMGTGIEWVHSYVTGDKVYCIYNADNEDLIKDPNRIQENMCNIFGLEREHHFSSYPEYVQDWIYDWNVSVTGRAGKQESDYGKRKLSNASVGKDPLAYRELCTPDQLAIFDEELKKAGYIN